MTAKDMHDIKWIRDNPDAFDRGLARRGLPGESCPSIPRSPSAGGI